MRRPTEMSHLSWAMTHIWIARTVMPPMVMVAASGIVQPSSQVQMPCKQQSRFSVRELFTDQSFAMLVKEHHRPYTEYAVWIPVDASREVTRPPGLLVARIPVDDR